MKWFWVSLPWATFGVGVEAGRVKEVPPIARWARGKQWAFVKSYYKGRGATIKKLGRP